MPRVNSASMPAQPVFLSGLRPHIWEGIGRPDSRPAVTRLVVAGSDAGFRLILPNSVNAARCFGTMPDAPARNEGARNRRVGKVDRERVVKYASLAARR